MSTQSDLEAIDWLVRLMYLVGESRQEIEALKLQFQQWATRSPENLRSLLETYALYQAIGECESELVGQLVATVNDDGIIVSVGPPGGGWEGR